MSWLEQLKPRWQPAVYAELKPAPLNRLSQTRTPTVARGGQEAR
jgi:hypothetical protein